MTANRLEAFSDGVIAIIITVMVLNFKVPTGDSLQDLRSVGVGIVSYILSFILAGIYWVNHYHLVHRVLKIDARTLWSNNHLLFWLSLTPFATAYLGNTQGAPMAVAFYGAIQTMCALSFWILRAAIIYHHPDDVKQSGFAKKSFAKNIVSIMLSSASIPLAFVYVPLALTCVALPAAMYFLPERKPDD